MWRSQYRIEFHQPIGFRSNDPAAILVTALAVAPTSGRKQCSIRSARHDIVSHLTVIIAMAIGTGNRLHRTRRPFSNSIALRRATPELSRCDGQWRKAGAGS
jgi:hypothetical protein